MFQTMIMPQSFPPKLMMCSSSEEKVTSWTRTLCNSWRRISLRVLQSHTMRCARNPMWLIWPDATSLPLGETSKVEMLWVWPERNSCLLVFRFRIEILLPIANTKWSWSGWIFNAILPAKKKQNRYDFRTFTRCATLPSYPKIWMMCNSWIFGSKSTDSASSSILDFSWNISAGKCLSLWK